MNFIITFIEVPWAMENAFVSKAKLSVARKVQIGTDKFWLEHIAFEELDLSEVFSFFERKRHSQNR